MNLCENYLIFLHELNTATSFSTLQVQAADAYQQPKPNSLSLQAPFPVFTGLILLLCWIKKILVTGKS